MDGWIENGWLAFGVRVLKIEQRLRVLAEKNFFFPTKLLCPFLGFDSSHP